MQFDPDPTRDIALNEKREANIGGKWVQCTPTGRRPAIKAVIDGEEPMPSRGYPGEPIRRKRAAASWSTYRRTRSGVMTAWNQAANEANPRLNRFLLFKMTGFKVRPESEQRRARSQTPASPVRGELPG